MNPYSAYRPSGVEWLGEVPKHWGMARVTDVFEARSGGTPSTAEDVYWEGAIPWVSAKDMKALRITDTEDHISEEAVGESATSLVPKGAVLLVARSGILKHTLPVGLAECEVAINQDIKGLIPDPTSVDALYFAYWTHGLQSALLTLWRQQGATVESLDFDSVRSTAFSLPPLDEQRAITAFLDRETERIDALVAKMRLLIERLQDYRTALITRTVTRGLPPDAAIAAGLDPSPRLKPSGVEWLGDVPEHWEVIENRRLFTERDERSDDGEGELLTVSHITGVTRRSEKPGVGMFMAESLEGYKACYTGDFVINTMWAWMGATGTAREAGLVSPSYNVYTPDPRRLLQRFVDLAYRSARYVLGMTSESRGIWTSRLRLYPQQFLSLVTAIPPMEEQQAIISHVDQIELDSLRILEAVEAAIERLQEYRTALITAAVTGKVDVREPVTADGS